MAFSRVNEGLKGLSKVSDNVAAGNNSAVPAIYRNRPDKIAKGTATSVDNGANAVLGSVGINPQLLGAFGRGNNPTIDAGYEAARGVYTDVSSGTFTSDKIGAAADAIEQMDAVLKNKPGAISNSTIADKVKAYAIDRAYSSIHPKFKFLYVIQFEFTKNFTEFADDANFMAFAVRSASRPTVSVEYEDVNMYNFKTKIPKYSEYQPATMTFYDDQSNKTTTFYKKYIEALIPNARMKQGTQDQYESTSFNFSSRSNDSQHNSSSLQALPTLAGGTSDNNIIKSIKLFHIWNWGQNLNIYHYFNPKISEINIGDLDMDSIEVTEIEIQFSYDGVYIETVSDANPNKPISLQPGHPDANGYNITELTTLPGLKAPNPIEYDGRGLEPFPPLGQTVSVNKALTEPVLDNKQVTKTTNDANFPDMNTLLGPRVDQNINEVPNANKGISGDLSVIDRFQGTLATSRNKFGDAVPNAHDISLLFAAAPKPVKPKVRDFTAKGAEDEDF